MIAASAKATASGNRRDHPVDEISDADDREHDEAEWPVPGSFPCSRNSPFLSEYATHPGKAAGAGTAGRRCPAFSSTPRSATEAMAAPSAICTRGRGRRWRDIRANTAADHGRPAAEAATAIVSTRYLFQCRSGRNFGGRPAVPWRCGSCHPPICLGPPFAGSVFDGHVCRTHALGRVVYDIVEIPHDPPELLQQLSLRREPS